MQLKFAKITMTLIDVATGQEVTKMERDEQFIWTVTGPVYPKHMKLMAYLNEDLKDIDSSDGKIKK